MEGITCSAEKEDQGEVQDCSHRTENDHVTSPGGLSKQDAQRLTPSFGFATLWIRFLSSMAYAKKKKITQ